MAATRPNDEVAVAVCVLEGKNMTLPAGSSSNSYLKAVAVLGDGREREELHSDPVPYDENVLYFDTELIWTMGKKAYQKFCSNKTKLKVSIFVLGKEGHNNLCIGHVVLDLREATRIDGQVKSDRSFSQAASWKRLIGAKVPAGKPAPHLRLSLCVDFSLKKRIASEKSLRETDQSVSDIPTDVSMNSGSKCEETNLKPKLNKERGYFAIGPEDQEGAKLFFLHVFVIYAKYLQSLKQVCGDGSSPTGNQERYRFSYSLFGIPIETSEFSCLQRPRIVAERAIVTILSTPELLANYFSKALPFRIYLENTSDIRLGFVDFEWEKFFRISTCRLHKGELIVYDGPLPVEKISHDDYDEPGPKRRRSSESNTERPIVGVRFSLGSIKDQGFATSQEPHGVLDRYHSHDTVLDSTMEQSDQQQSRSFHELLDLSQPSQSVGRHFVSPVQPPERDSHATGPSTSKIIANPHQNSSLPITFSAVKPKETTRHRSLDSKVNHRKKYKLIVNLQAIELNLKNPVECVLEYTYAPVCSTNISTEPPFSVVPAAKVSVRRGLCEYSFSATESVIRNKFSKNNLKVEILNASDQKRLKIGSATLDLLPIFSTPLVADFTGNAIRESIVTVPIISSHNEIGKLVIGLKLIDGGFQNADDGQDRVDSFRPIQQHEEEASSVLENMEVGQRPAAVAPSNSEVEKVTLELEEWKNKQKEQFKQQLQNLESQHLATLGCEWEKRHKEKETQIQKERAELQKYLHLAKEQKAKDDSIAKARKKALDEKEEKLQSIVAEKDRKELKDFENSLKSLKIENGILKRDLANAKAEITQIKSKNLSLQEENSSLKKKASQDFRDRNGVLEKLNEKYKLAWQSSENEVKQLRAQLEAARQAEMSRAEAREKDYRSQLIDANKVFQEKFATNNNNNLELQTTDKGGAGTSRNVENNNRKSSDLIRLTQQREMLLKSGAYSLTDDIIRALDTEIAEIKQKLI